MSDFIVGLCWVALIVLTFSLLALLMVRWLTGRDDADWDPSEVGAAVLGCTLGGVAGWMYLEYTRYAANPGWIFFGGFVGALLGAWGWYRAQRMVE